VGWRAISRFSFVRSFVARRREWGCGELAGGGEVESFSRAKNESVGPARNQDTARRRRRQSAHGASARDAPLVVPQCRASMPPHFFELGCGVPPPPPTQRGSASARRGKRQCARRCVWAQTTGAPPRPPRAHTHRSLATHKAVASPVDRFGHRSCLVVRPWRRLSLASRSCSSEILVCSFQAN
jgi:hypothetical protein